jgi:hypothetical protein
MKKHYKTALYLLHLIVTLSFIIFFPLAALVLPSHPLDFDRGLALAPLVWNGMEWSGALAGLKLSAYKTRDIHRPIPIPSLQATDRLQTGSTPLRPTHYSQRPKNTNIHSSMSHRIGNHVAAICRTVCTSIQTTTPCSEERPQLRRRPGHRAVLNTSVRPLATPSCTS